MILPNKDEFQFKECTIAGDLCWLITPKDMKTVWTDENARFRSCIVRQSDNYVVSQGFGKFVNYSERPDFQPWDDLWKFEARHKLDGSLLIVSRYKGQWILRTRGTSDARQLANGHEVDLLMRKYKRFFDAHVFEDTERASVLFEWTTPSNIIVLREHDTPTLTLLSIVGHDRCEYAVQVALDNIAKIYGFNRPAPYIYASIAECIADVKAWKGKEGVVIYSPDGQIMKKIKADAHLELHRLATGIKNVNQVLDVFLASPKFTAYEDFYNYLVTTIDFEVAEKCKDFITQIIEAYNKILIKLHEVHHIVEQNREGFSRREQSEQFRKHFQGWQLSASYILLDKKEIPNSLWEKSIKEEL